MTTFDNQQSPSAQSPAQQFGTEGIAAMGRPSFVTRMFMSIVAFVERLNLSHSKVGNPPIYENQVFPWTKAIEAEWRAIRPSSTAS